MALFRLIGSTSLGHLQDLTEARGYQNRSEAIGDLARAGLQKLPDLERHPPCLAALVHVYDHTRRELAKRLTTSFSHCHDLSVSTLHVPLDDARGLEVTLLKGLSDEIRHSADRLFAERGLRHGQFFMKPSDVGA